MAEENSQDEEKIITIRPDEEVMSRQSLPYFVGVSEQSVGAKAISMNLIVIPPGGAADAHLHRGYETAIYVLEGSVQTFYGEGLKKSTTNQAGDFMFIPANVAHQPVNLSQTEPARAIVARNDANEQESVEHYPDANRSD